MKKKSKDFIIGKFFSDGIRSVMKEVDVVDKKNIGGVRMV